MGSSAVFDPTTGTVQADSEPMKIQEDRTAEQRRDDEESFHEEKPRREREEVETTRSAAKAGQHLEQIHGTRQ